jgi:hypothetical protein
MKKNNALLILLLSLMVCSCKKNNSQKVQGDTFFKLYNLPIQTNHKSSNTTIASSGSMVSDANGSIYVWYYDSTVAALGRVAILKTDNKGNKIWNASYIPMLVACTDIDLNLNYFFKEDFVCIGQSLFICGRDSSGNWQLLKINCSDGKLTDQIPLNILQPGYRPYFQVRAMWATNEGNLLIGSWSAPGGGFQTPILSMMDPSGNLIWTNKSFPGRVPDSVNFNEEPCCFRELSNGNYIFGTIGFYTFNDSSGNSLTSSMLYLHHINSSGNIVSTDSLYQGTYNNSGLPAFINSNGASQIFYVFPSQGGYIIVSMEMYDFNQDTRLKILKTNGSLVVTDSSYISYTSTVLTSIAQDRAGNVIMSVCSQALPWPNAICDIYRITPDGAVTKPVEIGLTDQSAFISGIYPTNDNYLFMAGLIQSGNVDNNHLFILKTDNNVHY